MKEWNFICEIRNFSHCGNEQFEQIRADLELTMSREKFTACVAFYTRAKRDPLFGELQLLDRLAATAPEPFTTRFMQLDTNDIAMVQTYADMLQKRLELMPDAKVPMSLGETFFLASAALERGGKERALKGISLSLSDYETQNFEEPFVGAIGSSSLLGISKEQKRCNAAKVGDICILIRCGSLSQRAFRKELRKLLDDRDFSSLLHGCLRIGKAGILPLLLSTASGLYIDLNRIGSGAETSPEMLAGELDGNCIVILPKQNVEAALVKIGSLGMKGTVFAAITGGKQTILKTASPTNLIFDSDFLRRLYAPSPVSAVLKDEQEADVICHTPRNPFVCRYLASEPLQSETDRLEHMTVATATCKIVNSPFRSAILTSLAPVLTLAMSGGDYTEMRYAVDLEIPDGADHGEMLAPVLGIYRTQAELGIPAASQRIRRSSSETVRLTVFAVAKDAKPLPCRFQKAESNVYLVSVPIQENGIPEFPAFRAMLAELSKITLDGKILSAKVLTNESVTDALQEMRREGLSVQLSDLSASDGAIPCAVVLESAEELPFAKIGTVAEEPISKPDEEESFQIPAGKNLIWRKAPEAVVLANADDIDARVFAERLKSFGIETAVFTPDESGPMSRAMLTANAVFVCENAEWTENKQIALSRSVLKRNGGEILSLGSVDPVPSEIPHRSYPNGLPKFLKKND